MEDFKTKNSFEKAFKKAVSNFDETKIWFEHSSKFHNNIKICFILNGVLKKFPMYKSQYYIDIWKNHFIEFINTGEFDYHGYWIIYKSKDGCINENINIGEVLKFSLCDNGSNFFYEHSRELNDYLQNYREKIDDSVGIKLVTKPETLIKTSNVYNTWEEVFEQSEKENGKKYNNLKAWLIQNFNVPQKNK